MKFLLVALNAKYIHSNPGLYSLRAYAGEKYRDNIELAEYTINHEPGTVLADLYKRQPDVVGFSCYIWNWNQIQDIIREFHKLMPQVPIWIGGPEVSYDAREILAEHSEITGVMVGEGEATFLDLLKYYCLEEGADTLSQIKGIVTKESTNEVRELTDMDTLPFLYENLDTFKNRIIYYESSRGCPFRCSYCLSSVDKKVRIRDFSIVKKELQFFLDNQVSQVKFVDRTFNCDHEHTMKVWRYLLEHDNGVTNFHFEIEADILREDEIEILHKMRPGLAQMEIGVQSTNPKTLLEIRRNVNLEKLEKTVAAVMEGNNIHVHLDLIAGLPYEDYDSFKNSFNRVYAMHPEQLQLGFLKVLKGSYMHEKAEEYGIKYLSKPPYEVLYTSWLSYEDVIRLKKIEEMVELYYNSNQFTHTLPVLLTQFDSPFTMFEELADFYEEKGYFTTTPARSYRYEVLLQFALQKDRKRDALYKELLTFDMYLRENLKSRPSFAGELSCEKEEIKSFFTKEVEERKYLPYYADFDARSLARMTHLEPFCYPVWEKEAAAQEKKLDKKQYVLFDYQKRNPLTYEAKYESNIRLT